MKKNEILVSLNLKNKEDRKGIIDKALSFSENNADGIVISEEYNSDSEHDENLHTLINLCEKVNIPVYVKVNKDHFEDIKKYLYTGCKGVIISEKNDNLFKESVDRFGNSTGNIETKDSETPIQSDVKFSDFKTNENGLIPCIVQDYKDNTVLMMAYMNEESFNKTLDTGKMTYFSRSRNKLWIKGEESGHFQYVKSLSADCDKDTLLAKVKQVGVACHTGERSCFFNNIIGHNDYSTGATTDPLKEVYEIIMDRKHNPKEGSYTNYLFDKGVDKILKKVGEECTEIVIAAKNPEPLEIIYEVADFIYHVSVLMAQKDITWDQVYKELKNR